MERLTAQRGFTSLCLRMVGSLNTSQAVAVKESLRLTGQLDYPHAEIKMVLDSSMQFYRLAACSKEPETVEWIETHVRPGDVFYDIGANVGAYSLVAHAVAGGDCTVYAFEPSYSTFAALSENVRLNHCDGKIVPLHVALSAETKVFTFNYSLVVPGAASHGLDQPIGEDLKPFVPSFTQPILSYKLDELIEQFSLLTPNHIKLDVDGSELDVLKGAEKTLSGTGLKSILVEIDEAQQRGEMIRANLERKGFEVKTRHQRRGSASLANYIFERRD